MTMARQEISIGADRVGENFPPYVIAEAGVHHYNSVALAKDYILRARVAGVQAVKFQTYTASRIASRWAPTYWNDPEGRTQYEIFAGRSKFGRDEYAELVEYSGGLGITFLSTPFDPDAAVLLNELGIPAFKIASADLTYVPLLRTVGEFGKPVLLSTGASTLDEIHAAVEVVQRCEVPVALLHCTLSYPTSLPAANLRRITALRNEFPDLVIGYSDHTQPQESELACPISVALGARIIEKHFTLNKLLPGDDHYHAVDEAGLGRLVRNCADTYTMNSSFNELSESEMAARTYARRSIVASRAIRKGEIFSIENLDCKRPGTGMHPGQFDRLIGRPAEHDYEADALILEAEL